MSDATPDPTLTPSEREALHGAVWRSDSRGLAVVAVYAVVEAIVATRVQEILDWFHLDRCERTAFMQAQSGGVGPQPEEVMPPEQHSAARSTGAASLRVPVAPPPAAPSFDVAALRERWLAWRETTCGTADPETGSYVGSLARKIVEATTIGNALLAALEAPPAPAPPAVQRCRACGWTHDPAIACERASHSSADLDSAASEPPAAPVHVYARLAADVRRYIQTTPIERPKNIAALGWDIQDWEDIERVLLAYSVPLREEP